MLTASGFRARLDELQAARKAANDAGEDIGPINAQVNALFESQIPPDDVAGREGLSERVSSRRMGSIRRAGIRRRMDPGLSEDAGQGLTMTQKREASSITVAEHVYDAAVERINREAPDAPVGAQSEAMIRYAGYLVDSGPGDVTEPGGPDPARAGAGAWFRSGAASVLAPYKPRRAV